MQLAFFYSLNQVIYQVPCEQLVWFLECNNFNTGVRVVE